MTTEIERFYERELAFINTSDEKSELARYFQQTYPGEARFAVEFSRRFRAQAGQLLLSPDQPVDPHADRFIQAFALLAGRIQFKIGEEFPNLTEALLGILYPHLLLPVPSMAIAQFTPSSSNPPPPEGIHIRQGSPLMSQVAGHPPITCQWRVGYPLDLWPVEVTAAKLTPAPLLGSMPMPDGTAAVLQLSLSCQTDLSFHQLSLEKLRFFLFGDRQIIASLYELLFNNSIAVAFVGKDSEGSSKEITLTSQEALRPVGFEQEEALFPYPDESFAGYRLLNEFFCFPSKFLFADLAGFDRVRDSKIGNQLEVRIFLNHTRQDLERVIDGKTFQPGCTPIVNLFDKLAEPIALTHRQPEYKIIPDRVNDRGIEVFSIDEVSVFDPNAEQVVDYQPFYSFAYNQTRENQKAFWYAIRRPANAENDHGTNVYLVMVDEDFNPHHPAEAAINIRLTCSNRDYPSRFLRDGHPLFIPGPKKIPNLQIQLLGAPSASYRPDLHRAGHWRWIAQSGLNHVPLSDPSEGRAALQEIMRLCNFSDPEKGQSQQAAVIHQMIKGITGLHSRRVTTRARSGKRMGICRGIEFTLELDQKNYVGTGAFLFASVLERFLGLYAGLNSFSQLVAKIDQGKGMLKRWPPRAANRQLR